MKFFFIYKSLAHPELAGNYVQPFTLEERLTHAKQAQKQLGATIPWLVDQMDNRFKHALGDRPNSEFVIDPKGKIVSKRAWSHPAQVRKELEEWVGKVEKVTKEEDLKLNVQLPLKEPAERGLIARVNRQQMQPIVMEPAIKPQGLPFYAKLRVEADAGLLKSGKGKLYIGFHLDPFHEAHWNNLTPPLKYILEPPEGAKVSKASGESPQMTVASDADPREFMLDVETWPTDKPIKLTVIYSACVAGTCRVMRQEYVLHLTRDKDGGGARGVGAGFWDPEEFTRQLLARDKNGDGKLDRSEVMGLILPHFAHFDTNEDGLLDSGELKEVARWLNEHHAPGAAPKPKGKK